MTCGWSLVSASRHIKRSKWGCDRVSTICAKDGRLALSGCLCSDAAACKVCVSWQFPDECSVPAVDHQFVDFSGTARGRREPETFEHKLDYLGIGRFHIRARNKA